MEAVEGSNPSAGSVSNRNESARLGVYPLDYAARNQDNGPINHVILDMAESTPRGRTGLVLISPSRHVILLR